MRVAAFEHNERVPTPVSRITIVEHGQDDAFVLSHLIERAGAKMTPQVFSSGEAVLEILAEAIKQNDPRALPTALLVNVWLKGLSGFDLLKWVRHQEALRAMTVILLSHFDEPRDLGKAVRLGADAYLIKFPPPAAMRDLIVELDERAGTPSSPVGVRVACNLLANGVMV